MSEPTQDVQPVQGQAITPNVADRFRQYLEHRAAEDQPKIGGDRLTEKQVTAILSAQTEDEVWDADAAGLIASQDLVGAEIEIRSLLIGSSNRDDIESGFLGDKYGLVECVAIAIPDEVFQVTNLEPGNEFIMDTGVSTVITKIRWFEANDKLPIRAVVKGIGTSNGRTVVKLVRPPKRAVEGQTAQ